MEETMKLKHALIAAFTGVCVATPVLADLVFPALTYRTGAYAVEQARPNEVFRSSARNWEASASNL